MREVRREITQSSDTIPLHNHLCRHISHAKTSASLCYTLPLLYSAFPHSQCLPSSLPLILPLTLLPSLSFSLTHSLTHSFSQFKKYKHEHKQKHTGRTYTSTKNTHLSSSLREYCIKIPKLHLVALEIAGVHGLDYTDLGEK